ncbi:MAG: tetratricopeptide repeat protein [Bacteroidaceae bacterium]
MKRILSYSIAFALVLFFAACSTKENTARNRFFHSFTAQYNIYYNGQVAYNEGCLAKETGNKDNFTEYLPLFTVGNKATASMGKSNFETAITKCEKAIKLHSIKRKPILKSNKRRTPKQKEYLARKEFNPFLKNAWLLMGKSQFQKGEFVEAASTFSYTCRLYATQPAILAEARAWLARCYVEQEWYYDAEDVLVKMKHDSIPRNAKNEYEATMADLLLRQERFTEAIPFLKQAVQNEKRKKQKARGYFLLGQVYNTLGQKQEAYKAFQKTIRQNPSYELAFNAHIQQTEVLSKGQGKKMIAKLNRMAKSPNNKDYLDQVFYAIGNIYLSQHDTLHAINAYEEGGSKSTRNGIEKGVLMLHLGNVYWERKQFADAQRCYRVAIGLIDKGTATYKQIDHRSAVLDELVPHTEAIHLQDSLQALVRMPESERLKKIDKLIEDLKRKEKEAKRAAADSTFNAEANSNGGAPSPLPSINNSIKPNDIGAWYFYNMQLVMKGKTEFQRQWGKRKNGDDWRRANKSVLATNEFEETNYNDTTIVDSTQVTTTDSIAHQKENNSAKDSICSDPHMREFYLAQLPFTEEQKAASDNLIKEALFKAGILEKDKLEDYVLSKSTFTRLYTQYPDFTPMDEVLYHLFLLESRWGTADAAETYRTQLATTYAKSDYTQLITAPDYALNARYGKHIEDSLYAATYKAYREGNTSEMATNCKRSELKYPNGENRAKFMFFEAMSSLQQHDRKRTVEVLKALVKKYPESEVSEMAGLIVKGIENGREIGSGRYDIGSLWNKRTVAADATTDSTRQNAKLNAERNTNFVFVFAYPADSVNEDQLLYELARYNFTSFMVRNFEIQTLRDGQLHEMMLKGFLNFDEVHNYTQRLYKEKNFSETLKKGRVVLISEDNLKLLGTVYSFDDYKTFYEKNFAPLKIKPELQLDQQTEEFLVPEDNAPGEKPKDEEKDKETPENTEDGEWYDIQ